MRKRFKPHRIARLYYAPRVIGFALTFVASLPLFLDGQVSWSMMLFGIMLLLVYPHLMYLRSGLAANGKTAEQHNLLVDAAFLGVWVAVIGFNVGLGFALLSAVALNNTMLGGFRRLGLSLACFGAGVLLASLLTGFRFAPYTSMLVTTLGLVGIMIYMLIVALLFHEQNQRLLGIKRDDERKRRLFQSLAATGLQLSEARTLEDLVDVSLDHLQAVLPASCGLGIVVRERMRAELVHCSAFRGMPPGLERTLLAQAAAHPGQLPASRPAGPEGGLCHWQGFGRGESQLSPIFVLCSPADGVADPRTVELYLQQLGAALENHALTLKLTELANTDALTGLANRARLDECLGRMIRHKQRSNGQDFTVVVADINGLKALNDTHGHEAGDRLIMTAAHVLKRACRETDVVARAGGDEFVVLCPSTTSDGCAHLLRRLLESARREYVAVMDAGGGQQRIALSLSVGSADSSECPPRDVMKLADQRMYAHKDAHYRARAVRRGPRSTPGEAILDGDISRGD